MPDLISFSFLLILRIITIQFAHKKEPKCRLHCYELQHVLIRYAQNKAMKKTCHRAEAFQTCKTSLEINNRRHLSLASSVCFGALVVLGIKKMAKETVLARKSCNPKKFCITGVPSDCITKPHVSGPNCIVNLTYGCSQQELVRQQVLVLENLVLRRRATP